MRTSAGHEHGLISTGVPRDVMPSGTLPSHDRCWLTRQRDRTSSPSFLRRPRPASACGWRCRRGCDALVGDAGRIELVEDRRDEAAPGSAGSGRRSTTHADRRPRARSRRRGVPIGAANAAATPSAPMSGASAGAQDAHAPAVGGNGRVRSASPAHARQRMDASRLRSLGSPVHGSSTRGSHDHRPAAAVGSRRRRRRARVGRGRAGRRHPRPRRRRRRWCCSRRPT